MDRAALWQIIESRIELSVADCIDNATDHRIRWHLNHIAETAFTTGTSYALSNLMTTEDVAMHFGITPRRVRAIAQNRNERFGIGWQVPGTNQWLFRPEELEQLRPDEKHRRK